MKKQVINYNWPASLSFSADNKNDNERFSRGKLAVFFKGETADHRFFSDEFSKTLIESLPYTPIVSHYDEQADDFVGHATEQDIYWHGIFHFYIQIETGDFFSANLKIACR